jgi:Protein of unknown function (DUF1800)
MRLAVLFSGVLSLVLLASVDAALAAERQVKSRDIKKTTVVALGKSRNVACFRNTPGSTKSRNKRLYFLSYSDEERSLSKQKKKSSSTKNRIKLLKVLKTEGGIACRSGGGGGGGNPGPRPDHLRLDQYDGPFGVSEAQTLYNRFGFGATQAQIFEAVQTGLQATINRMLTPVSEGMVEAIASDVECDGWRLGDPQSGTANRTCNASNVNDFSRFGTRTALLHRFINSQNGFLHRFAFWVMDERLAVSHSAARDCERYAVRSYLDSVYKLAREGNYTQYMREMNRDHLMHIRWLDGGTNRGGLAVAPNENWAREFWELGTVGPTDLSGNPVYSDLDIAQSALAFTGWNVDDINVNGNNHCLSSYVPLFHTEGPKTIFGGTPFQATVNNDEDVLQATFNHPRTAEHLAEDLWKEFVNPFATPTEIRELAQIIRDNNYNLLPVFRRLMASRAVYAPGSKSSLIRHPLEMVVGFLKTTGYPLWYRQYDEVLNRLEQQILNPNTVFGWDVKYLSGQQLQIEWWNTMMDYFINIDVDETKVDYGWSYYDRFVADLHNSGRRTSIDVVNRVAYDFGITLNDGQRAELDQMMNYYLTTYQCPAQCNGAPYRLVRAAYDTDPSATESGTDWNSQRRIRMLVAALMQLPQARLK